MKPYYFNQAERLAKLIKENRVAKVFIETNTDSNREKQQQATIELLERQHGELLEMIANNGWAIEKKTDEVVRKNGELDDKIIYLPIKL